MSLPHNRRIVVLGMMSKIPVPGVIWQTVQYLVGLRRLGFDPYYVEAHARSPTTFISSVGQDTSAWAAEFIAGVMRRFDFERRWAFHALHADGRCYGLTLNQLRKLYASAELIINLHGGTMPLPEQAATGRLVFLETDPVSLQLELYANQQHAIDFLEPHCAFFTFAENYGRPSCTLPTSNRFEFRPTRQPVVLDLWTDSAPPERSFSTVGRWRQLRDVQFQGEVYTWTKDEQFLKFVELPRKTEAEFELALSACEEPDRRLLEQHGWHVIDAFAFGTDIDRYRRYICSSRAEFTVAKDQNVRLRTGWFSDRSATYLAAGKPVITQETGFSELMPVGEGLYGYTSMEEAIAAVQGIRSDWRRHSRAAHDVAREVFDARRVLGALLEELGTPLVAQRRPAPQTKLTAVSRWPTTLAQSAVDAGMTRPCMPRVRAIGGDRFASIVMVTRNGLPFTGLCIRSLLAAGATGRYELIVVDNGSEDGTTQYLLDLADALPAVRVVENGHNAGFAAAVNRGLALATGDRLVLLNNDTVVPPQWLNRLQRHLEDPSIGLVGAVTNRSGDQAEVETGYETYGQFIRAARARAVAHSDERTDVSSLAMLCCSMRREVYEAVGPLDERFERAMFEDDDYVLRLRALGYRVVCAEDLLVHHFGQATVGELATSGEYGGTFHANRRRFEQKWGLAWKSHERRRSERRQQFLLAVNGAVADHIPPDSTVLVVSRGDDELLHNIAPGAAHFPQGDDSGYAGYHPANGSDAVAHLEALRETGACFLLLPHSEFWWLEHYPEFREHLEQRCELVYGDEDTCQLYSLSEPAAPLEVRAAAAGGTY